VYAGALDHTIEEVDPAKLPRTKTQIMVNVGDPEQAFKLAQIPNDGVGLARMEFIFAGWVRVHPLALTRYDTLPFAIKREVDQLTSAYADKTEYFVDNLARGIGTIAAAFWPRPVILRFSDFKTNSTARSTQPADDEGDHLVGDHFERLIGDVDNWEAVLAKQAKRCLQFFAECGWVRVGRMGQPQALLAAPSMCEEPTWISGQPDHSARVDLEQLQR
jgi:phosphoenolpyruvate synthase/pyruvate phosphate dikinase